MRRVVEVVTGVANSPTVPMDHRAQFFNVGIEVVVSATATYNVQYTMDDVYSSVAPTWFTLASPFTAATANAIGNLTTPCSGIRLNVTASTGTVTMTLLQSSGQG